MDRLLISIKKNLFIAPAYLDMLQKIIEEDKRRFLAQAEAEDKWEPEDPALPNARYYSWTINDWKLMEIEQLIAKFVSESEKIPNPPTYWGTDDGKP